MNFNPTDTLVTANAAWDGVERRQQNDRRQFNLHSVWQSLRAPRRFHGRRTADRREALLDRYDSGLCAMAILLVVLSITDSVFTLTILGRGGEELNPFMNSMLQHSVWLFMATKMVLTAVPAIVLVATNNLMIFNRVRARSLLAALVGLYAGLIVYELSLLNLSNTI